MIETIVVLVIVLLCWLLAGIGIARCFPRGMTDEEMYDEACREECDAHYAAEEERTRMVGNSEWVSPILRGEWKKAPPRDL